MIVIHLILKCIYVFLVVFNDLRAITKIHRIIKKKHVYNMRIDNIYLNLMIFLWMKVD